MIVLELSKSQFQDMVREDYTYEAASYIYDDLNERGGIFNFDRPVIRDMYSVTTDAEIEVGVDTIVGYLSTEEVVIK